MTAGVYFYNTLVEVVDRLVDADPAPSQSDQSMWCGALCADPDAMTDVLAWSDAHQTKVIKVWFAQDVFGFEYAEQGRWVRRLVWDQGVWAVVSGQPEPWEAPVFRSWFKLMDDLCQDSAFVMQTDAVKLEQVQALQNTALEQGAQAPKCIPMHAMLACCSWYGLERP